LRKHGGIAEILATKQFPGITGTRDNFGIGKEFYDKKHGWIDNYKKWERSGYSEPDFKGMKDADEMTDLVKYHRKKAKSKPPMDKRPYHETGRPPNKPRNNEVTL
jgi:hypothetical protein